MKRVNSILCASTLMVVLASTTLAGNITLRPGNITLKPGNITLKDEETKPDAITSAVIDIVTSILGNITL